MTEEMTTIKIPIELRERLKEKKVHPRQPYYEIIDGLLDEDT